MNDSLFRRTSAFVFPAVLLVNLVHALSRVLEGRLFGSADAFNRLGYAIRWAGEPFLAPPDQIWLTGNFAVLGLLIGLFGDPMLGVLAFSILSWLVLAGAVAWLGTELRIPPWATAIAAMLMVLHPAVRHLVLSPMPDLLSVGLVLGSAAGILAAVLRQSARALVAGMALAATATALRYEAWLWGAALSVAGTIWLAGNWKQLDSRWRIGTAASLALPFLFPLIWLAVSRAEYGDALFFTRNENNPLLRHFTWTGELRLEPGLEPTLGGRWRDAITLWGWWWRLAAAAMPFVLAFPAAAGRKRFLLGIAVPLLWLAIVGTISFRSGISGTSPERVTLVAVFAATLLGVGGFAWMIRRLWVEGSGLGALAGGIAVIGVAVGTGSCTAGRSASEVRTRAHYGVDSSAILMGWRMRYELGPEAEFLEGLPNDEPIHIWCPPARSSFGEIHAIRALSGSPRRLVEHWETDPPPIILGAHGPRLVLVSDVPGAILESAGYRLLTRSGSWELWGRNLLVAEGKNARTGGTNTEPTLIQDDFGLEWMAAAPDNAMTWSEARAFAEELEYGGHDDWRLPDWLELWKVSAYVTENEPAQDARLRPPQRVVWSNEPGKVPGTRRVIDLTRLFPYELSERMRAAVRPVRTAERQPEDRD